MINLKESLILEGKLKNYIKNGYLDINSFDNPDDEAAYALTELSYLNKELCEKYSRIIIESEVVGDDYLKSRCLDHLLDLNRKYALEYIEEHVKNMSIPILSTAMSGLVQYSNSKFRKKILPRLISEINKRYQFLISNDEFLKKLYINDYELFEDEFL